VRGHNNYLLLSQLMQHAPPLFVVSFALRLDARKRISMLELGISFTLFPNNNAKSCRFLLKDSNIVAALDFTWFRSTVQAAFTRCILPWLPPFFVFLSGWYFLRKIGKKGGKSTSSQRQTEKARPTY
jgi:hypothetical protein